MVAFIFILASDMAILAMFQQGRDAPATTNRFLVFNNMMVFTSPTFYFQYLTALFLNFRFCGMAILAMVQQGETPLPRRNRSFVFNNMTAFTNPIPYFQQHDGFVR